MNCESKFDFVVCSDKTFLLQNPASVTTIERIGTKNVKVKCSNEKLGCKVMLGAVLDVKKNTIKELKPQLIFKATAGGTVEKQFATRGVVKVRCNDSGWQKEDSFQEW